MDIMNKITALKYFTFLSIANLLWNSLSRMSLLLPLDQTAYSTSTITDVVIINTIQIALLAIFVIKRLDNPSTLVLKLLGFYKLAIMCLIFTDPNVLTKLSEVNYELIATVVFGIGYLGFGFIKYKHPPISMK